METGINRCLIQRGVCTVSETWNGRNSNSIKKLYFC